MSGFSVFDKAMADLSRTVNARHKYQEVLAGNIANSETPGYRPMRVDFDSALQAASDGTKMMSTHPNHMGFDGAKQHMPIKYDMTATPKEDGNSVDVEHEMVEMATNQILFDAASNALNKKIGLIKYVIAETR